MTATANVAALSFKITPLSREFAARVRATRRDDFGREAAPIIAKGGEPVRDQLRRVEPGERIMLCSYQSVALPSGFAEIGPIFICADEPAEVTHWQDELPPGYFNRPFALRAYSEADEIVESAIVAPDKAPALIRRWLARGEVAHLHARFAGHGCFACRFDRVT